MNYDKILVKIEDKKEYKILKGLLKHWYKVALYAVDDKEVSLNKDGSFEENVDVIISTSSFQNGQTIKENIQSISVQKYGKQKMKKKNSSISVHTYRKQKICWIVHNII